MTTPQDNTNTTERAPQSSRSLRTNRGASGPEQAEHTCRREEPGCGSHYIARELPPSQVPLPRTGTARRGPYTFFKEEEGGERRGYPTARGTPSKVASKIQSLTRPRRGGSQPDAPPSRTSKTFTTVLPSFVDPGSRSS